jgi:hypothetical protein
MNFSSDNAYLFKVTPVYGKDAYGEDTEEIKFYRLTFRVCQVSGNALATISYFDLIPSIAITNKYKDTFEDMVGKTYKIKGTISRTYNKDLQKGYTNFYLSEIE